MQVTATHQMWSLDAGGWVAAGTLKAGDRLAGEDGPVTVESVTPAGQSMPVYNLDIDEDHQYLVTALGVLSHNTCPGPGGSTPQQRLYTDAIPHTDPAKVLNLGGLGEFPGATDMNELPGGAIFQRMDEPWTTVSDDSMEGIIGNNLPGFSPKECDFICSEAYRVLQPGGEMRVNSQAGPYTTMLNAMVKTGFKNVYVKDVTVIGTK